LEGTYEYTLGRVSGNQPILPDIDLTPFQAYEGGVSRLHATIRVDPDQVFINDLGSANGTRINGKKMAAHSTQELADGDMISLGKFKIQILIRESN
jgi:pSer/pThr/pTyr-binding forkhead associated (FHA) protein